MKSIGAPAQDFIYDPINFAKYAVFYVLCFKFNFKF